MSTEVAIKSAIAEWESRSTAVKLMISSMVRSKNDMNAAAANRARREERKREKNELAAKKRQAKEEAKVRLRIKAKTRTNEERTPRGSAMQAQAGTPRQLRRSPAANWT